MGDDAMTRLRAGGVIPAHPLALSASRELDEARQRALTRHYVAAGASGVAVGVHTTQFGIHDPSVGLYEPVLRMAAEELDAVAPEGLVRVAGLCGDIAQVVAEAELARGLGFQVGLLSMAAWGSEPEHRILEHVRRAGRTIPVMAFYMQPAVGGRAFSADFWCRLLDDPNVRAVKVAAFDRYRTVDVARAVAITGRDDVALYTGNDDSLVTDLLTPFRVARGTGDVDVRFVGGLLGQWALGTAAAVTLLDHVHLLATADDVRRVLAVGVNYTDANGAVFDAANGFAGCVPGINEVLRREGHVASVACLDPDERLSPGQDAEITRVLAAYPHLWDPAAMRAMLQGAAVGA